MSTPPDLMKRLEIAIARCPRGEARHNLIEATREISRLRARDEEHGQFWFYLLAHPEHAGMVARHVLFGNELSFDATGHVTAITGLPGPAVPEEETP